jgi:hypothetical protein
MHIDAPKVAVTSARDFASKYAMFVVSILTALTLEHLGQKLYHYKIASEASVRIDEELRANLAEIRLVRAHNEKQYAAMDALAKSLAKDLKAKLPDAEILRNFQTASNGRLSLNLQTPTLRHEAWDVAVANQSASHMSADALGRYSKAYARLRDDQVGVPTMIQVTINGPQMISVMSDLGIGRVAPLDLFHVVMQMRGAIHEAANTTKQADQEITALLQQGSR